MFTIGYLIRSLARRQMLQPPPLRLQFGREEFRCENIESFKTVLSEEL